MQVIATHIYIAATANVVNVSRREAMDSVTLVTSFFIVVAAIPFHWFQSLSYIYI